jgi:hypothetical protein
LIIGRPCLRGVAWPPRHRFGALLRRSLTARSFGTFARKTENGFMAERIVS